MNKIQTFNEFLSTQAAYISVQALIVNLLLAAFLALLLSKLYVKYGNSLSNRAFFSRNFILLTITTTLIITVVKSSLALSLGLVGALSIVRFRVAIKEPEELTYLFLVIAIGLGLGADQRLIVLVSFLLIGFIIMLKGKYYNKSQNQNLHLSITTNSKKTTLNNISRTIKDNVVVAKLVRFTENKNNLDISFLVELNNFDQLNKLKNKLSDLDNDLTINFLDINGIA